MKNKFLYNLILIFMLGGVSPLLGQGFILQKDIVVEYDEVQDNVVCLGGEILIKGIVHENAMAFGGKIIVEGEVQGSVVGFGAEIVSRIQENAFDHLDCPIARVAGLDTPIPFSPPLERSSVPEAKDIVSAVMRVLYD